MPKERYSKGALVVEEPKPKPKITVESSVFNAKRIIEKKKKEKKKKLDEASRY